MQVSSSRAPRAKLRESVGSGAHNVSMPNTVERDTCRIDDIRCMNDSKAGSDGGNAVSPPTRCTADSDHTDPSTNTAALPGAVLNAQRETLAAHQAAVVEGVDPRFAEVHRVSPFADEAVALRVNGATPSWNTVLDTY